MTALKTTTKPAAKTRAKAPAKTKPQTVFHYAVLLAKALEGQYGIAVRNFYRSAEKYHAKQGTVFPRARLAGVTLMNPENAEVWLTKHTACGIPSGDDEGQRLYDAMRVEAAKAK